MQALVIFILSLGSASTYQMVYQGGVPLYLQPCPASDISSSSVEFHSREKWPEWLQARLCCMNDIMTVDHGIVWFWKSSIRGAVNRTVAVVCRPRFLAKCLNSMQGKMEGHRGDGCMENTQAHTHTALASGGRSGCRAALIGTFYRVVVLPWVR